jgi:hypothetical protein
LDPTGRDRKGGEHGLPDLIRCSVGIDRLETGGPLRIDLMHNAGRVLSRPLIIEHVWDYGYAIEPSGVETYISYLRRKLDDRDARLIRIVRGVGYALREPEPAPVSERR